MITSKQKDLLQELIDMGASAASNAVIKSQKPEDKTAIRSKLKDILDLEETINSIPLTEIKKIK